MAVMLHLEDETTAGLTTQDAAAPCPELQGTEPGPAFLLPQAAGGADPAPLCSLASFPGGTPRAPACPQSSAGDPAESSSLQRLDGVSAAWPRATRHRPCCAPPRPEAGALRTPPHPTRVPSRLGASAGGTELQTTPSSIPPSSDLGQAPTPPSVTCCGRTCGQSASRACLWPEIMSTKEPEV